MGPLLSVLLLLLPLTTPSPTPLQPPNATTISQALFDDLSTLSQLVDISYCVGTLSSGITPPFSCLSYCHLFPTLELIQTWNTGLALSDSCGYIALSHAPAPRRILVAFRGTYSLTNALVDLRAAHEPYACDNCTVHAGFVTSWAQTSKIVVPVLQQLVLRYPGYVVTLVGHSMGGAVAALAGLDFAERGWKPQVTTFGEPRVGNAAFAAFVDSVFGGEREYRRVTHVDDPVPLVPPHSMGFRQHAHEIFIAKQSLPFQKSDVRRCEGQDDAECSAGGGVSVWRSLVAHRDYFHRLGVCLPVESVWNKWGAGEAELRKREVQDESLFLE